MKNKRIVLILVAFLSFFIINDRVLAVHGSGGGSQIDGVQGAKPSASQKFDSCLKNGHSKDQCIDKCYETYDTLISPSDAVDTILSNIISYEYPDMVQDYGALFGMNWEDFISKKVKKVCIETVGTNESNCNEIESLVSLEATYHRIQEYMQSLSSGTYNIKIEFRDSTALSTINYQFTYTNPNDPPAEAKETNESTTYKCYKYYHEETWNTPAYNTTLWSNRDPGCGFQETNWTKDQCMDATLTKASYDYSPNKDQKITRSGYNGSPDFYVRGNAEDVEIKCANYKALHVVYRVIIIAAPILAVLFVTYDLVKSIISGDEKKVSEFRKKLIRRLIALLLLITIPIIVSILVNTLSKNEKIKDDSFIKCMISGDDSSINISSSNASSTSTTSSKQGKKSTTSHSSNSGSSSTSTSSKQSKKSTTSSSSTTKKKVTQKASTYNSASNSSKSSPNSRSTTPSKVYGATSNAKVISVSGTNYVAINSKYPGGLAAQAKSFASEGIRQSYRPSDTNWGGCCWTMAHIHACGVAKSAKLTLDSTKLRNRYSPTECANAPVSCGFEKEYKPSTESELVNYVIKKIQSGKPVVIKVVKKSCSKKCRRHFVTVVGFKNYDPTSASDFLIIDSWDAKLERMDKNNRKIGPCNILRNKRGCKGTQYYARAVK